MTREQRKAMKRLLKRRKEMLDKRAKKSRQEAEAAQEEADATGELRNMISTDEDSDGSYSDSDTD